MTALEFRNNSELVTELRVALASPIIKLARETLRENGPEFRPQPLGMTPTDAAARLGHICGYAEYHASLELLTDRSLEHEPLKATYAPEPIGEEEE